MNPNCGWGWPWLIKTYIENINLIHNLHKTSFMDDFLKSLRFFITTEGNHMKVFLNELNIFLTFWNKKTKKNEEKHKNCHIYHDSPTHTTSQKLGLCSCLSGLAWKFRNYVEKKEKEEGKEIRKEWRKKRNF